MQPLPAPTRSSVCSDLYPNHVPSECTRLADADGETSVAGTKQGHGNAERAVRPLRKTARAAGSTGGRTRLCVLTLGYSREAVYLLTWRSSAQIGFGTRRSPRCRLGSPARGESVPRTPCRFEVTSPSPRGPTVVSARSSTATPSLPLHDGARGSSVVCGPARGTKSPSYSDVLYLEALIGPDTVTTIPHDAGCPTQRPRSRSVDD